MAYKTGVNRTQINLFPICLDEGIADDNVVRVINAFVDWLDIEKLGFLHSTDNLLGTSMYPPKMLLKLYLYGYLNRIRSSRRLELECTRNIELHWLLHRMTPGYHTISDFRKNNPESLKGVFKEFTQFCITLSLVGGEEVAFDGTKIHAQNNPKNNFNAARLEKLLLRIDSKTQQYEQYSHIPHPFEQNALIMLIYRWKKHLSLKILTI
jgi:transposase